MRSIIISLWLLMITILLNGTPFPCEAGHKTILVSESPPELTNLNPSTSKHKDKADESAVDAHSDTGQSRNQDQLDTSRAFQPDSRHNTDRVLGCSTAA